jgi:molecular chaperone GrpE
VKEEEEQTGEEVPKQEETSAEGTNPSAEASVDEVVVDGESEAEAEKEPLTTEERLEQLETQAAEYLDGWQRARAEFVNYKKRVERERAESRSRIAAELLTRYLDVLDDLDRTLSEMPEDIGETPWSHGLQMVYQKMQLILESEDVVTIEAVGEYFDPNFHEAISFEESDDYKEGQVVDVIQKGYMLGDRVLRPAMVRVAK